MSTGSIQSPSKTLFKFLADGALKQTFTASEDLVAGDAVKISGDGMVNKAAAAEYSIGVVTVGGENGDTVTVFLSGYNADALAVATGSALTAGQFVTYNGSNTDGVPQVVLATSGQIAKGVVLVGGDDAAEVRIGIIQGFFAAP